MREEEKTYRENIDKRLDWLETHYSIWNDEFGEVKTNVKWLVKSHWVVVTASVGAFLATVIKLLK